MTGMSWKLISYIRGNQSFLLEIFKIFQISTYPTDINFNTADSFRYITAVNDKRQQKIFILNLKYRFETIFS